MVDVAPYSGDYKGVVVTNNTIAGGFATSSDTGSATKGTNNEDVIIKYGQLLFSYHMKVLTRMFQNRNCNWSSNLVWESVSQQRQHWRDSA
jgi:hypothetical protein